MRRAERQCRRTSVFQAAAQNATVVFTLVGSAASSIRPHGCNAGSRLRCASRTKAGKIPVNCSRRELSSNAKPHQENRPTPDKRSRTSLRNHRRDSEQSDRAHSVLVQHTYPIPQNGLKSRYEKDANGPSCANQHNAHRGTHVVVRFLHAQTRTPDTVGSQVHCPCRPRAQAA